MAVLTTVVPAGVGRNFKEIARTGSGVERRRSRQEDWFGSIVVCTTASAAEVGRHFKEENPTRRITADGASKDADMSRIWVGTTWPITPKNIYRRRGCLWVPPGRDRGRAGCGWERVAANKIRGDWA